MGPSNTGALVVSEPNLKLRYKPKKSLERRKNPLLRKESAPPSLRRRPAETLGGEGQRGGEGWLVWLVWSLCVRSHPDRGPLQGCVCGCTGCVLRTHQRDKLELKASHCSVG